jgi:hypothetical protein
MGFFEKMFGGSSAAEKNEAPHSVEKLVGCLKEWSQTLPGESGIVNEYQGGSQKIVGQKLEKVIEQIDNLSQEEIESAYGEANMTEMEKQVLAHEIYQRRKPAAL